MTKKKQSKRNNLRLNEKCFNYRKKDHYTKDCHSSNSNKRKSVKKLIKKTKRIQWKKNQVQATVARLTSNNNNLIQNFT